MLAIRIVDTLAGLHDIDLSGLQDQDSMQYNLSTTTWVRVPVSTVISTAAALAPATTARNVIQASADLQTPLTVRQFSTSVADLFVAQLQDGSTNVFRVMADGRVGIGASATATLHVTRTAAAATPANPTYLQVVAVADTALTLSTEAIDVLFDLSASRQFATGALATQRALRVVAPTYTAVSGSTLTKVATVAISGNPIAGTNATLTNAWALWVESGNVQIGGTAVAASALGVTRAASTGTLTPILRVVNAADTGMTNANFFGDVIFSLDTNVKTFTGGGGAMGGANAMEIDCATTFAAASTQTITSAVGLRIVGNPVAGTNMTLTNSCAVQIQGRVCIGDNIATQIGAGFSYQSARSGTSNAFALRPKWTANLTASTESTTLVVDPAVNGTVTWSSGALAVQRENYFTAPTYAATAGSVFTDVATLAISGAPVAGTNMTLTRTMALWVQAGNARFDGNVTMGAVNPTARLHLPAGTATASTAPLKLTSGTSLTTAEAGAVEFDGDSFFITPRGTRRKVPMASDSISAAVNVNATTAETELGRCTVAANELIAGRVIRLRVMGVYTTASTTPTVTFNLRLNSTSGTILASVVSSVATVSNGVVELEFTVSCRTTGASGTIIAGVAGSINQVYKTAHGTATTTVDTTAAQHLLICALWSNNTGTNALAAHQCYADILG